VPPATRLAGEVAERFSSVPKSGGECRGEFRLDMDVESRMSCTWRSKNSEFHGKIVELMAARKLMHELRFTEVPVPFS